MRTAANGGRSAAADITRNGVPLWTWADPGAIDQLCRQQADDLTRIPSAVHVALMPDAHGGYGMPIGGVVATEGTVVPNAVGIDIGCGVVAVRTIFSADEVRPHVERIFDGLFKTIPVGIPGHGHRAIFDTAQGSQALRDWAAEAPYLKLDERELRTVIDRADRQVGTLGSGNHFASLEHDEDGRVWVILHSGSRAFGKLICERYDRAAHGLCAAQGVPLASAELATLPLDHELGRGYLAEMGHAMRFAEESRARMVERVRDALREVLGRYDEDDRSETHHNYARVETHFGRPLTVHRKGAVRAYDGDAGRGLVVTIPGSMQTGSYIGEGRPSALALNSCSHGAGRALARGAARRAFKGTDILAEMRAEGLVLRCPPGGDGVLEEVGRAYKDVDDVMDRQADLVTPVHRLHPLGTLKG